MLHTVHKPTDKLCVGDIVGLFVIVPLPNGEAAMVMLGDGVIVEELIKVADELIVDDGLIARCVGDGVPDKVGVADILATMPEIVTLRM